MTHSLITYQVKTEYGIRERYSHAYIFKLYVDFIPVIYDKVLSSSGVLSYRKGFVLKESSYAKAENFAKAQAEKDGYQFLKIN